MNKTIYKSYSYSKKEYEEKLTGCLETVRWKSVKYYGGPEEPGYYYVSDGDGKVYTLHYDTTGKELFERIMDRYYNGGVQYSNGKNLTNDDLIELYQSYRVWYDVYDCWTDCGNDAVLSIITEEQLPKYFMEPEFKGPIDSELDTYGKKYVDVDGYILKDEEVKEEA